MPLVQVRAIWSPSGITCSLWLMMASMAGSFGRRTGHPTERKWFSTLSKGVKARFRRILRLSANRLFFGAIGTEGLGLWTSDGTEEGTVQVGADIGEGPIGPEWLVEFDGKLFFAARDVDAGNELWTSDGTSGGTFRVHDLNPMGDANPGQLTVVDDSLYFAASDGVHGSELWVLRNDSEVTRLTDLNEGSADSFPLNLIGSPTGDLFFTASTGLPNVSLFTLDGSGSIIELEIFENDFPFANPNSFAFLGNNLLFSARDGVSHGFELWRSDGTVNGTERLVDIYPGPMPSQPFGIIQLGKNAFFTANDGGRGFELWKTDGTSDGTAIVRDINPTGSASIISITIFRGEIVFAADDGLTGVELWKSDGTELGTVLLADLVEGETGSQPSQFTHFRDMLFFSANQPNSDAQLWRLTRPGDLDFDGDVDAADRTTLARNWTDALTAGTGVSEYRQGDVDGDPGH